MAWASVWTEAGPSLLTQVKQNATHQLGRDALPHLCGSAQTTPVADAFFAKRYGHRAIVLETVAAVPGMVGATLTYLHTLRRMVNDEGWIRTLLEAQGRRDPLSPPDCETGSARARPRNHRPSAAATAWPHR